ncbi:hypothetical protein Ancab_010751 [Ancistrocladus abbreviatus]
MWASKQKEKFWEAAFNEHRLENGMLDEGISSMAWIGDQKSSGLQSSFQQVKNIRETNPSPDILEEENRPPSPLLEFITSDNKRRLRWTHQLHNRFVEAVTELGGPFEATPKLVLQKMGLDGLTILHVKSHLQKFRYRNLPDSNRETLDPHLADEGIFTVPVEDRPYAGICSSMPGSAMNNRNALNSHKLSQIAPYQTAMQTSRQIRSQVEGKLTMQEDAFNRYLDPLVQSAYKLCGDQATFLPETVDLLACQSTMLPVGLEDHHGYLPPKDFYCIQTASTLMGLQAQATIYPPEKFLQGQRTSNSIRFEGASTLTEEPTDFGAFTENFLQQMNDYGQGSFTAMVDCFPSENPTFPVSLEANPFYFQSQTVSHHLTESMTVTLTSELKPVSFQPQMLSYCLPAETTIPIGPKREITSQKGENCSAQNCLLLHGDTKDTRKNSHVRTT